MSQGWRRGMWRQCWSNAPVRAQSECIYFFLSKSGSFSCSSFTIMLGWVFFFFFMSRLNLFVVYSRSQTSRAGFLNDNPAQLLGSATGASWELLPGFKVTLRRCSFLWIPFLLLPFVTSASESEVISIASHATHSLWFFNLCVCTSSTLCSVSQSRSVYLHFGCIFVMLKVNA